MPPKYEYAKQIKTPNELGMSDRGSLSQIVKNVDGLIDYVGVLVSGNTRGTKTGRPLGNKYFVETIAKCKDEDTGEKVKRHIYINNVPSGDVPFISSAMGANFTSFKGLIPGTISNLNAMNPNHIINSLQAKSTPVCRQMTLETIDENNTIGTETKHLTLEDIENMNPCEFRERQNPITKDFCRETFESMHAFTKTRNNKEHCANSKITKRNAIHTSNHGEGANLIHKNTYENASPFYEYKKVEKSPESSSNIDIYNYVIMTMGVSGLLLMLYALQKRK